jgi:hypothetical protein
MLALVAVIMAYRGQYLIERYFGRFKGQALRPIHDLAPVPIRLHGRGPIRK